MDATCPLCLKIQQAAKLPDDELVWQFPCSVAVLGPWQLYHGYCILIARSHAAELLDLPPAESRSLYDEMLLLATAIRAVVQPRKLNFELLGNQVAHPHWHVFPRFATDPHHRQPVWEDLAQAEADPQVRTRCETGPEPRDQTIRRLQRELRRITGLPA